MGDHVRWQDTQFYRDHMEEMRTSFKYRWTYRSNVVRMKVRYRLWRLFHPWVVLRERRERKELGL